MSKKRKKQKVRNAGIPARHSREQDGSTTKQEDAGRMPAVQETPSSLAAAVEREREIRKLAFELYLEEGGHELEVLLENGQYTRGVYQSQMTAARDGGEGWGPTVTPYEDRMTRSLQLKLIKQRNEWIERCRKRIEDQVAQIEAEQREQEEAENKAALNAQFTSVARERIRQAIESAYDEPSEEPELGEVTVETPETAGVT